MVCNVCKVCNVYNVRQEQQGLFFITNVKNDTCSISRFLC